MVTKLYLWDEWFAIRVPFKLMRGRHYTCTPAAMTQQIRNAAAARGIKVSISCDKHDTFTVTVTEWPRQRRGNRHASVTR